MGGEAHGRGDATALTVTVAAVQFRRGDRSHPAALSALTALADEAGAHGARLIVLPEMAATGYVFADRSAIDAVSESATEGPTLAALAPVAKRHRAWVVAGFPEREGEARYNSALIIGPDGALVDVYRKHLLYEVDTTWADAAEGPYPVVDTAFGRMTVGICMDLNDPRFIAHCETSGARLLAFPTNWTDQGHRIWGYWHHQLQHTAGLHLVAANTWGQEAGTAFRGESAVIDIDGRTVLAAAPFEGDGVIWAEMAGR